MRRTRQVTPRFTLTLSLLCTVALAACTATPASTPSTTLHIEDGAAQPILEYTDPRADGYRNAESDIWRFSVYVESDYDTDGDGKRDLVRAFVQVPRAAAEGTCQAPAVFEASPYNAGQMSRDAGFRYEEPPLTDADLQVQPEPRIATRSMSTTDLALDEEITNTSLWSYQLDEYGETLPSLFDKFDYFLVRGFAVVQASGLGTSGSEGIECCGTRVERDAFAAVVEWLHGDRVAFTGLDGSTTIDASWCSGHVGMTGISWCGTLAWEVATTGVEGLDTIVPVAGIADWYDWKNQQGLCVDDMANYNALTVLTDTCSSRLHTDAQRADNPELLDRYQRYRTYLQDEQTRLAGDYGDFWQARDYYTDHGDLKASALIVEGLNDENVRTKHADLIRSALVDAGCEVKVLFHQNGHVVPADEANHTDIMIGDHTYLEWLNLWFCHYLAGVDNEVGAMASFTVQSNVDGTFYATESFDEREAGLTIKPGEPGETTLVSEGSQLSRAELKGSQEIDLAGKSVARWTLPIGEDVTIAGKIPVHLRMRTDALGEGDIGVSATLVDASDQEFRAFGAAGTPEEEVVEDHGGTSTDYDLVRWVQDATKRKVITFSSMDLRNPEAGYEPASATTRPEPIEEKTSYDYTLWLDPTYYTVCAGHRLELYVTPSSANAFTASKEEREGLIFTLERYGLSEEGLIDAGHDYGFTIENDQSYAEIPVAGQMRPLKTDG